MELPLCPKVEFQSTGANSKTSNIWRRSDVLPISLLEGEMPGRAEGGNAGQDDHHLSSVTPANPAIRNSLAFSNPSGW
ncbi:Hypothetical protein RG540_CH37250 [Neorhizobium galegae bv. orientalis str. HAMBI 540]|uniref:Propionyl-coenzyme A carboxylase alpha polypeptide n=1 Tax=Neorhizobium galegae bv. orientalis str. HAMBI 540 TaxID=1028800 RepID=A0A068SUD2_NEOGA|nr:Hypothetical protein RG540_CH37250 [Neorhizobium galegae bv. orientalis str. HAMBI 540]